MCHFLKIDKSLHVKTHPHTPITKFRHIWEHQFSLTQFLGVFSLLPLRENTCYVGVYSLLSLGEQTFWRLKFANKWWWALVSGVHIKFVAPRKTSYRVIVFFRRVYGFQRLFCKTLWDIFVVVQSFQINNKKQGLKYTETSLFATFRQSSVAIIK